MNNARRQAPSWGAFKDLKLKQSLTVVRETPSQALSGSNLDGDERVGPAFDIRAIQEAPSANFYANSSAIKSETEFDHLGEGALYQVGRHLASIVGAGAATLSLLAAILIGMPTADQSAKMAYVDQAMESRSVTANQVEKIVMTQKAPSVSYYVAESASPDNAIDEIVETIALTVELPIPSVSQRIAIADGAASFIIPERREDDDLIPLPRSLAMNPISLWDEGIFSEGSDDEAFLSGSGITEIALPAPRPRF